MKSKIKLEGLVHVDEFEVGGKTKGKPERAHSDKRKVMIALEIRKGKKRKNSKKPKATAGNMRLHQIYDYTQKTFEDFFQTSIKSVMVDLIRTVFKLHIIETKLEYQSV